MSLALSLQLGLIAIVVVMIERYLARSSLHVDARRTNKPFAVELARWRWPTAALVGGLVLLSLAAPVGVLAWWSVRGWLRGSTDAAALAQSLGELAGPTINTSVVAVAAAVCAVALVTPVAYLFVRHRSRVSGAANALIVGGFALPGLVIALSLVFWTLGTPVLGALYQTLPLLVLAYVVHFGAQSLRTAQVAVASVPANVEDAARSLGATRWRRFVRVELPLMLPGLLSGAGIVLLSTMKELPASLILAPAGFQTLAIKIWSATESAIFADASLASLLLISLSGALTWLVVIRGSHETR
jgi:iron(III) transport system permease protein